MSAPAGSPRSAPARVLVIAGSDSSGGAGVQADIKTITMLGGYAMTAITAITAQNTLGVTAVEVLSPQLVAAQIDACLSDIGADAVKIGMLGSPAIAHGVADRLEGIRVPIVFDPVMVASSGAVLADADTVAAFERLMALATLTTPNLPELAALTGSGEGQLTGSGICEAAARLASRHGTNVLAKGGHGDSEAVTDWLAAPDGSTAPFDHTRIESRHTHGTGCTLASAIATQLGGGAALGQAVGEARAFVRAALLAAPGFGGGHGPMGHQAVR